MTKEQKVTRKKVKTAIERANSDLRAALKDAFKCGGLGYQDRLIEVLSVANHHTEKSTQLHGVRGPQQQANTKRRYWILRRGKK